MVELAFTRPQRHKDISITKNLNQQRDEIKTKRTPLNFIGDRISTFTIELIKSVLTQFEYSKTINSLTFKVALMDSPYK